MRTREAGYKDYGMTEKETNQLLKLCQNADSETEKLLLMAAQESSRPLAADLFYGLKHNLSYEDMCKRSYVFANKSDFYGYRRKTLFLFKEKLKENDKNVVEQWEQDNYIRRYLSKEKAEEETSLEEYKLMDLARKAKAVLKIGNMCLVEMVTFYNYLDKEFKQKEITK